MTNFILYAVTVLVWGSSWIAVAMQLGDVPVQVSIAYRFFLAAFVMYVFCRLSGRRIRFAASDHARIALQGLLLFCLNYFLIYLCTQYLTSGLVSVIFSTLVVWNIVGTAIMFRKPISIQVGLGATLGLGGIAAVFWPELSAFNVSGPTVTGLALGLAAAISASGGMLISARFQKRGLPLIETTTLAMFYGALFMSTLNLVLGDPFAFDTSLRYVSSLFFLALLGSVVGFGCYLTLVGRIGADRAGYATLLFPIIALTLSTLFENFHWTGPGLLGVALVLIGNVIILLKPKLPTAVKPLTLRNDEPTP